MDIQQYDQEFLPQILLFILFFGSLNDMQFFGKFPTLAVISKRRVKVLFDEVNVFLNENQLKYHAQLSHFSKNSVYLSSLPM